MADGAAAAGDATKWFAELDRAWASSVAAVLESGGPCTVLFSGGVDSGLLGWELRHAPGVRLTTIGLDGADDLDTARRAAAVLDLPWEPVVLEPTALDLLRADARAAFPDGLPGLGLALAALLRYAPDGRLVCGQGADELFLGYAHFRGLSLPAAAARADADLDRLIERDWPATVRLAARWGRTVSAPFLEAGFVRAARSVPLALRLPEGRPKEFWRSWARHRGLPDAIAAQPKRALQYGSGVDRWLRRRSTG